MKKALSLVLALVMVLMISAVFAAAKAPVVYVTIANGELVLVREKITLKDVDGDGALTIYDALYLAHEAKYKGGAAAGFGTATGDYGLYISKLWGVENGGSYGYFLNDASAYGLTEPLTDGDELYAFVYTDATYFTDAYSYFDVKQGKNSVELTFYVGSYDENWNTVFTATEGAEITIDGVATGIKTNRNGRATVSVDTAGTHVVSATLEGALIVPPVCTLKKSATPAAGDTGIIVLAIAGVISLAAFGMIKGKKA
ncbi:MAG: hypothetical protein J5760_02180 [Clostridia bacterium]|nr:hypothetical protein [Clostridia bacterium]